MDIQYARSFLSNKLPLIDQAVVSGGNFLQGLLLARALGADGLGAWAIGQLALLFALGLNQAGLTTPMLTFLGRKNAGERAAYLRSLARLQVAAALAAGLLAAVSVPFFFEKNVLPAPVLGLAVAFSLVSDFHRRRLLGLQKAGAALLLDAVMVGVQIAGFGWFWLAGGLDLPLAWGIWLVANGLAVCLGFVFFEKNTAGKTDDPSVVSVASEHWQEGRWLLATSALQWFSGNFLLAASGVWLGQAALGTARMAQNAVGLLNILFISLENTLPVPAARLFSERGGAGLAGFLKCVFLKNGPFVALFLVGLGWQAGPVFRLLFGQSPEGAQLAVCGFAAVYALTFAALPLRVGLRTVGRSWSLFLAYVVSAAFSMVAARPLLEGWGLAGLAAGLAVCQLLQLAVYGSTWAFFLRAAREGLRPDTLRWQVFDLLGQSRTQVKDLPTERVGSQTLTSDDIP